jgi:hypothetical protein
MMRQNLFKTKKKGSALVMAMIIVVVLSLTGIAIITVGQGSRILAVRKISQIKARCATDAGLSKALYLMNEKLKTKPYIEGTLPEVTDEAVVGSDSSYSYTVSKVDGVYTIQSTGTYNAMQKTVLAYLSLRGVHEYAILGKDKVDLKAKANVDWYNYDTDDNAMAVGVVSTSNNSLTLKNGSYINGDIVVSPDGIPDNIIKGLSSADVTGDVYATMEDPPLPDVTVPDWLESLPSGGDIENNATITTSGKYDSIDLGNNETITIDGSVSLYITGDIELGNSAQLQIVNESTNPDASLKLYIGGDYEGKNGSNLNNGTQKPKKLRIYGLNSCSQMTFKNSSDFYGAIYAPNSNVTFMNSADVYGSVVAGEFEQKNSADFNYDASLRDEDKNNQGVRFVITRWKEL